MNDSKLIRLYKTLNATERKRFKQYVESDFFNTNPQVIKLNEFIIGYFNINKVEEMDKKKAFLQLFGKKKYSDTYITSIMNLLMQQLEDFIPQLTFDNSKILRKEFLLAELRKRKLGKHFITNTNIYLKCLNEKKIQDSDYYYEHYVLEKEIDHFFMEEEVRESNESLQRKSDYLDIFFLSEKLKNLCEMVNRQNIIKNDYNLRMLNELRSYIDNNIKYFETIPVVYIYYKILQSLMDNTSPQYFKELKQVLYKFNKQFTNEEAKHMYDYAQNYCIKKINSGDLNYLEELFSIYKSLLENELIFEGKLLSQWDYKNIVSIALRLEKFDWTKKFIEEYKIHIAHEFRENAYEYNLASYYYSKHDYKNALKLLQKVDFTDVFYHVGAKSILMKIYYELDDVEPFYSLIDAFKIYLARNKKISIHQRLIYQNLIKYTRNAFNLKLKGFEPSRMAYQKEIEQLKEKINAQKNIPNLQWLQERVSEL